jgi:ankyrin repeat protein
MRLVRACGDGDEAAVGAILSAGPELALQAAAHGASRDSAKEFFFESIQHYMYAADTALHLAAAAFRPNIARALLAHGAAIDARNRRSATPLHYAADTNRWQPEAQAETIGILLEAAATIDARDASGTTPLHRAVRTRGTSAVRALLEGGADVRGPNAGGSTPLHLAVQNTGRGGSGTPDAVARQREMIELLLAHGAKPSDTDAKGKSALAAARVAWVRQLLDERSPLDRLPRLL